MEPFAESNRLGAVEHPVSRFIGLAVDKIAAEALQHRGVAVAPPVGAGVEVAQIDRVLVIGKLRERLQRRLKLFRIPRVVNGRDRHARRLECGPATVEHEHRVRLADRVDFVVVDS